MTKLRDLFVMPNEDFCYAVAIGNEDCELKKQYNALEVEIRKYSKLFKGHVKVEKKCGGGGGSAYIVMAELTGKPSIYGLLALNLQIAWAVLMGRIIVNHP